MHERLAVYVPNVEAAPLPSISVRNIDRGSGIVGVPLLDDPRAAPRIHIYYEGNRYGYANVVTYADRCCQAASRLTEKYPTIATAVVLAEALTQVGWYHPTERRVEIRDVNDMIAITDWLDIEIEDSARLDAELRET